MHRYLLIASLVIGGCTATVRTAGPPPAAPPPAAPPVAEEPPPAEPPPALPPPVANEQHPAYLHALADLRLARAFLQRPANVVVKWDEQNAIKQIETSMRAIQQAAIDDHKDMNDHPPVDAPTWGGRLQRALELVQRARNDISQEEDSPNSRVHKLRDYAFAHLNAAERYIQQGIRITSESHEPPAPPAPPPPPPPADKPGAHPAYLHALSDLRFARALLETPVKGVEVNWDVNKAVGNLDAAMKEIRDAAIDDGKPLTDHPPVDANMHHRDRLKQAIDTLEKAAHDIEEREDNNFAKGMRGRAVGHIRDAIRFTREAIEDRKERKEEHGGKKH